MQNTKSPNLSNLTEFNNCLTPDSAKTAYILCSEQQAQFLNDIIDGPATDIAEKLMLIHDIALYHSDDYELCIEDKTALYALKIIVDNMRKLNNFPGVKNLKE